jgi:tetratricopeptide (TPR) repeat protein
LADSHGNLGELLADRERWAEAEAEYRAALALDEKLAAEFPALPAYQSDLALNHNNLGMALRALKRPAEAAAEFREALAVRQKLAADHPDVLQYAVDEGYTCWSLANLVRDTGAAAALEWYDRAIARLAPVVARQPRLARAREYLRDSHKGRAEALVQLRRFPEALGDYDRALELDNGSERSRLRMRRAAAVAQAGDPTRAAAEVEAAAAADGVPAAALADGACALALAAKGDPAAADRHAAAAVALLRRAVAQGYDGARLDSDPALDPLRRRADFQALVAPLVPVGPPAPR